MEYYVMPLAEPSVLDIVRQPDARPRNEAA